jgi:Tfp pilus assembly protein PilX
MKPLTKQHLPERDRGFALVITLSLMVLLTLLAVGLLSLSSIALRTSAQGSAIAIARSNARLAMIIALGQLQKTAGQDQRVTAPADLAGDTGGIRLAAGKAPLNTKSVNGIVSGLTAVQPGTRYWTGVWDTVTTAAPATQIYTKTPGATNVRWLISGNEMSTTLPEEFDPSSAIAAVSAAGAVNDDTEAVVLVGPATVGPASATTIDNFVSAPLVAITTPTPNGGESRGRYAWWIGDEGVKARYNRASQDSKEAVTYPTLATQRSGWEVVTGMQNYPTPPDTRHYLLDRVVTLPEGELLNASLQTSVGEPVALFHAATADSFGVLADSLQGGLRLDLTAYLNKGFPASNPSTFPNAPKQNTNIIPATVARNIRGPKWDALKAFYSQSRSLTDGKLLVKGAASANDLTIAPLILDLRLLMGVRVVAIDGSTYRLNPCGKLAVALANPYPYPLEWKSNLELEIIDETPTANGRDCRIWNAAGSCAFMGRKGLNEPAVFNNAYFVIPKGELAPGEARAYTMGGPVVRAANDVGQVKVDLKPFSSSSPLNFSNCVELQENAVNSGGKSLDVRESWTTTQPTAELRLAGGSSNSNLLRRLERFELDNCYFSTTSRNVDANTATLMKEPFPLHLYGFQISQPGMKYETLLPSADLMGTRSSTLRTFADFNLRAVKFGKLITAYNPPPYFMQSSDNMGDLPMNTPGGDTGQGFTRDLAVTPLAWGRSAVGGGKKTILFSFPKNFVSLAQLQHADLTADDLAVSISQQPGNAVGNSYATPFVKRKQTIQSRTNYVATGAGGGSEDTTTNYYDMSYLLNATLFDTFYFSTIGEESSLTPLNKSIVVVHQPASSGPLEDPVSAAAHLMINGAFNINSTNKDSWKALLAGNRFLKHPADAAGGSSDDALFPRSLEQRSPSAAQPTGAADDSFAGFRRLTNQQIDAIAEEMVKQVRLRGPFVSLSHFANRALVDMASRTATASIPLARSGALQSALDNSGVNITPTGNKNAFKNIVVNDDKVILQFDSSNAPKADVFGPQFNNTRGTNYVGTNDDGQPVWASQSMDLNPGAVASILADRIILTDSKHRPEQGYRSTGIPGWVTQADVLQVIGPSIAARSDTFRIRTYGEALSSDGKIVLAKAWCEAIVQRMPDYVDSADAATERLATPTDNTLTPINKLFGRKFEIVSFRWLSQDEI